MRGLDVFREYFKDYGRHYTVIGGLACYIHLEGIVDARVTHDVDMILFVEVLSKDFAEQFKRFIRDGGYDTYVNRKDKTCYYRYLNPQDYSFPKQIELFSRDDSLLESFENTTIIPLEFPDELSDVSVILLDEAYYDLAKSSTHQIDGISVLGPIETMIFKMKAFLDLSDRKEKGDRVNSNDIKKHVTDVLRLSMLLDGTPYLIENESVAFDVESFLSQIEIDDQRMHSLKLADASTVKGLLEQTFLDTRAG